MFVYEKKLQYPVRIANPNPKLAAFIISQYGGPDGELGASLRYLSQRYTMPYPELKALLRTAGLEPVYSTHWNFLPLPLVWIRRKLLPAPQGSDVGDYPWWIALPMRAMMALERVWLDGDDFGDGRAPVDDRDTPPLAD